MPSPFPGMDPFIEGQSWSNFHTRIIVAISDILLPSLRPRYVIEVEERVYLEHEDEDRHHIVPDVTILDDGSVPLGSRGDTAVLTAPLVVTLPIPEEVKEHYLTIRKREMLDVVTIIEMLSPANKRTGSDGRSEYLRKREQVLKSPTHLVEIDLLRGGERLPVREKLPSFDYLMVVSRRRIRPSAHAFPVS